MLSSVTPFSLIFSIATFDLTNPQTIPETFAPKNSTNSIAFKSVLLTFKSLHGLEPIYLAELVGIYTPTTSLRLYGTKQTKPDIDISLYYYIHYLNLLKLIRLKYLYGH